MQVFWLGICYQTLKLTFVTWTGPMQDLLPLLNNPFIAGAVLLCGFVLLYLLYRLSKGLVRGMTVLMVKHQLRNSFSPLTITNAWNGFYSPQVFFGGKTHRLIPYIQENILTKKDKIYSHYLLFGDSGMGKTTAMIRLFAAYKYRLTGKDYQVRLVSLSDPGATRMLKGMGNKEKTVVLLDGLEDFYMAAKNYKTGMDQVLKDTEDYAKVIISVEKGFLPAKIEGEIQDELVKYTGDECYQLFGRMEMLHMDHAEAIKFSKRRLVAPDKDTRLRAKELMFRNPGLFHRPGWTKWMEPLVRSRQTASYPFEIYQIAAHSWLGHIKGSEEDKSRIFTFSAKLATTVWRKVADYKQWAILVEDAESLAKEYGVDLKAVLGTFLEEFPDGKIQFVHKGFLGLFLAWEAYYDDWPAEDTHFEALPEAASFFRQMCWKYTVGGKLPLKGKVRTLMHQEKRELQAITFDEIGEITRLYLDMSDLPDRRFLRGLTSLKGLYLDGAGLEMLNVLLLKEFPHQQLMVYLRETGKIKAVYHFDEAGGFQPVNFHPRFSPLLSVRPDATDRARKSRIPVLEIFANSPSDLPNEHCHPHPLPAGDVGDAVSMYRLHLGVAEMDLFNLVEIYVMDDSSRNVIFSNTYLPTMITYNLRDITNALVSIYGEDDRNMEEFGPDDEAQIEDGLWLGRKWFWKNSDRYPYPIHLYLEEPGHARLEVFGTFPAPSDSPDTSAEKEIENER